MIAELEIVVVEEKDELQLARDYVHELMKTEAWKKIDQLEEVMAALPEEEQLIPPLTHVFTPGLYGRKVLFEKGALIISRIHLTEHQFVILRGVVSVWDDEHGVVTLTAGHHGVTKVGTRRLFFAHEECELMTFHATNSTDPDEIIMKITFTGGGRHQNIGAAKS